MVRPYTRVGVGVAQKCDVIEQNGFQIRNQRPKITHNQLSDSSHLKKKFVLNFTKNGGHLGFYKNGV